MKKKLALGLGLLALMFASGAYAAQPEPWQLGMQPAATPVMAAIRWFEQYTLWFIVPVTVMVTLLLAVCIVRFRAKANPVPSRTSHNTLIEVLWTLGPVLVLLVLAVPSFQLLTFQYRPDTEPTMTIKATGMQWYWDYEYQTDGDNDGEVSFSSLMLQEEDRDAADKTDMAVYPRLLAVDNELVVPVDTTIRLLVTAGDVIHSFAMPAFGLKTDGVPGRLNETWFRAEREGFYYGQCSELCGKDHAYMPIAVRVVSQEQFNDWFAAAQDDLDDANKALTASVSTSEAVGKVAGVN